MIKKLSKSIREYKKDSILTPIYVSFEVFLEVLVPFLMATLIDKGIEGGDDKLIWGIGSILVLLCLLSLMFGALSGLAAARASCGFAKNIRKDMYDNIQKYSFSNIDKLSTASIITRLTTDVSNIQQAYQVIIRIAVRSPIMFLFSMIMSFITNPSIALIFVLATPVLALGVYIIMRNAHPIFERVFKRYDNLNNVVEENLLGVRVVKSFVREDFESNKFKGASKVIFDDFIKAEKLIVLNTPLMQFVMYICMILLSWFSAKFIVSDTMTTGELSSIITYAMQILSSLMMISMVFVTLILSRASAERIVEVLDEKSDIFSPENAVTKVENGNIKFENVSFGYSKSKEKYALKNINISIKSGETIGIIGGTGSSKTTFVQLIPRLYDASKGIVYVGDVDVKKYDLTALRNQVAIVLQKNQLFSGTIKENLRWGNENATDEELIEACKLAQADEFIQSMPNKYDTYIEQGGTNVSGGQKQRLCIARALLKKPKIIILDDSTSAVDTKTDLLIRNAFKKYIPETTKIIIAQRISSVEDADKIIVFNNGEINGVGTHEELLETNEIYKEVYNSQVRGGKISG